MVTPHEMSENTHMLRDWFLGEQGQRLIEDAGYAPIR